MRRGEAFWGLLLVLLGGLFLLSAAGFLVGDVFGWFWPILLIALGMWILLDRPRPRDRLRWGRSFSIPLQGAQEASLRIDHGAGRIDILSGAATQELIRLGAGVAMSQTAALDGERLDVRIEAGPSFIPFVGPEGGTWEYRLNSAVPIEMVIRSGASRVNADLKDLLIRQFRFEGGAGRLELRLPSNVQSMSAEIEAGAARVDLRVPAEISLRIQSESPSFLDIDEARFPHRGGAYQSPDFEVAAHRADVRITGGASSVHVHQEAP
jgi:hypothetical protein